MASGAREVMFPVLWTGRTLHRVPVQCRTVALGTGNGEGLSSRLLRAGRCVGVPSQHLRVTLGSPVKSHVLSGVTPEGPTGSKPEAARQL